MFVRRKRNQSGSTSVQVISKVKGRYLVTKTIGCAREPDQIRRFEQQAEAFIIRQNKQLALFPKNETNNGIIEDFVSALGNHHIRTIGPELIFGTLFDRIGFSSIPEQLFRDLVIARLAHPTSKLKTVDYLERYRGIKVTADTLYRFLDRLQSQYKDQVESIAYEFSKARLRNIAVVFYDMTTLYFEADDEDDLRKIGFSKDGKFQHPQILLGLLVGRNGRPIGYDIFEGNTFEGHTLLPTIAKIQEKFGLKNPVVVADSALLSKDNLKNLSSAQYNFIVGARIKNESKAIQEEILKNARDLKDGESFEIQRLDGLRLIVSYSQSRANKDAHNRQRGLTKLIKQVRSGRLTKQNLNQRGYNKFLKLQGAVTIQIDEQKVQNDIKWDGLKGYLTNTSLPKAVVIENYKELWQIEKAFRISKTDLRIRPIYHYRKHRIEAHVCIAFVAYAIYKELEYLLQRAGVPISPKRAAELTHTMYELQYSLPNDPNPQSAILKMNAEQQALFDLIHG